MVADVNVCSIHGLRFFVTGFRSRALVACVAMYILPTGPHAFNVGGLAVLADDCRRYGSTPAVGLVAVAFDADRDIPRVPPHDRGA